MNSSNARMVQEAIDKVAESVQPVSTESVFWRDAYGRILAESIFADRDSPPSDVSAMDGYAVRRSDISMGWIPVTDTITAGKPPCELPIGVAIRVFTGASVPSGSECVVKREDTEERPAKIRILPSGQEYEIGQSIRYQGENVRRGEEVISPGEKLTGASIAAIAAFGASRFQIHRKVRVAIVNTGDELVDIDSPALPHQIRDSNGPTLEFLLGSFPWIEVVSRQRCSDDLDGLARTVQYLQTIADTVILTGGVSMGDTDFVPEAIEKSGGKILVHKLPIRPGRPILAAVGAGGALIIGLPGNPVSVAVTLNRIGLVWLKKQAGFSSWIPKVAQVMLTNGDEKTLNLEWFRLARLVDFGRAELLESRGSGDLVSLAKSDGFVSIATGSCGAGPWGWFAWPG